MPAPTFSLLKKRLSRTRLQELIDAEQTHKAIERNLQLAQRAPAVRKQQGIFQFPDYENLFTFDGSIILRDVPDNVLAHHPFFKKPDRILKLDASTCLLRGPQYLISIDPTKEVRQKLQVLTDCFYDAIEEIMPTESGTGQDFLLQSAMLDYAKNAAITMLNAFVQREKMGNFRLTDKRYQALRTQAVAVAKYTTMAHFAHLLGEEDDKYAFIDMLIDHFGDMTDLQTYLRGEYVEGIFSSRQFTRPEASHPLRIAASSYVTAKRADPIPDTIIGLPAGGTELAFTQLYAFENLLGHECDLLLAPLSLHSVKQTFKDGKPDTGALGEFLKRHGGVLTRKNVLIVEDNSSTGRTIQTLANVLDEIVTPSDIHVSVAEADVIRSELDRASPDRTHIASPKIYSRAVGILPVSRYLQKKTDLKEIAETRRLLMAYRRKLEATTDLNSRVLAAARVRMIETPTEEVLGTLNDKNAILTFRHTFLSNFYGVTIPITYGGKSYPSVEHAYQAQKFPPAVLRSVSETCLSDINAVLQARGSQHRFDRADQIFTTELLSAGNAKLIADVLRKHYDVRDGWDDEKMPLMVELLLQKFRNNKDLADKLLQTGDKYLVEGNTWNDTLWGVCDGRGRNLLGILLMEIRDTVLKEPEMALA